MFSYHDERAARSAGHADAGQTTDVPQRQPVDADVQEAADDQRRTCRHTMTRASSRS